MLTWSPRRRTSSYSRRLSINKIRIPNTVGLHLSGLIGTACHPVMQIIRIIRLFFKNRLHWQFEVRLLLFRVCTCFRSVGIATDYGLHGPGSDAGGDEIFRTCPDRPWGPPSLLYNGYTDFPGGKERPGSDADTSPPSSAFVKKE